MIREIVDNLAQTAIENLTRDGYLFPMGFLIGENGVASIVPLAFDSPAMKAASICMLGSIANEGGWDTVVLISDTCMVVRPAGSPDGPRPAEDPSHTEAILVSVKHRDGRASCLIVPYTRDKDKKVASFGETKRFDDGQQFAIGLMDGVFPKQHTEH